MKGLILVHVGTLVVSAQAYVPSLLHSNRRYLEKGQSTVSSRISDTVQINNCIPRHRQRMPVSPIFANPDDFLQIQNFIASFSDVAASHTWTSVANHGLDALVKSTDSTFVIADATAVTATSIPSDGNGDISWWDSYVNIFKQSINLVHSVIDQPLRTLGFEQTWGLSILLFTAGVRSLLVPLSIQQTKSSEYIKALKPYQDEIKTKFKGNQDMINRVTGKLFQDAKANPLAGCLVSVLQLPIFLGLYRGVNLLAQDGKLNEPFLFIPSLQGPVSPPDYRGLDWLTTGWHTGVNGLPEPGLGWATTAAFLVMPIVLVLGQAFTMRTLSPPPDESASKVEKEEYEKTQGVIKFLPLLIGYFSMQVPAGLTIYWFTSNLFTLMQSVAVRGYYKANPPKVELPDYWDSLEKSEDMTPEERREAVKAGLAVGPKMEDMLDEARFHVFIERKPLREKSTAWKRAVNEAVSIPMEMVEWVEGKSDSGDMNVTSKQNKELTVTQ